VQDRGGVKVDGTKAKASVLSKDFSKSYEKAGFIKGDKKLPVKLSKPAKSLNQKSDQAYRLHEQTKAKVERLKGKLSDLYDEGSKLQERLDEAKSKVESGRTKKASSTQKDIGKFAASLQSELANGGQPVPVMRQKGNKKQIAELDEKINENFNQRISLQSQVKRLQSRAGKLLDASQDYADKASRATTKSNRGLEVTYNKKGDLSSAATAAKAKKAISGQAKGGKVVKKKIQNIYEVAQELTDRYGVPLSQVKKDQWVVTRDGQLTRANVIKVRSDGSIKINPSRSDSLPTNPQEKVAVLSNEKDFLAAKATLDKAKPKPKKQRNGVSVYIDKASRYESEVTDLFAKYPYVSKLYETSNSSGTYLSQRKPKSGRFSVVTRSDFKKMLNREGSDSRVYDDGRGSSRFDRMSNRI